MLKIIENDTILSGTHDILLTFQSKHGLSRTVSGIDGDFSWKSQKSPLYFRVPTEGLPVELGTRDGACSHVDKVKAKLGRGNGADATTVWKSILCACYVCSCWARLQQQWSAYETHTGREWETSCMQLFLSCSKHFLWIFASRTLT